MWHTITSLGAAGVVLPLFALQLLGLQAHHRAAANRWLLAFIVAVSVTLLSKLAFKGWGLGSAVLDFTGASGHSLLASAVLPVFFRLRAPASRPVLRHVGTAFGVLLALAVGVSRLKLDAHSISEVLAGWALGFAVSAVALSALGSTVRQSGWARLAPLALLLVFIPTFGGIVPTEDVLDKVALRLSGQTHPFRRYHLKKLHAPVAVPPGWVSPVRGRPASDPATSLSL